MRFMSVIFFVGLISLCIYWPALNLLPSYKKSIAVFAWPGMFDSQTLARFEKQTGIKVHLSYYESNEELLLKLGNGRDYDLIVPSDYTVGRLRSKGILKKLDTRKLPVMHSINPLFLSHYYDEHNEYFVPLEWAVFGIGVNKTCFRSPPEESWRIIFDPALLKSGHVAMTNDPFVAIPIASLFLTGSIDIKDDEAIDAIEKILARQRPWVVAYTDYRAGYYLTSKDACLAVTSSSMLIQSMEDNPDIDFIIPREGSLVTIEGFAIPAASSKQELAYEFINFMLAPEQVAERYRELGYFPTTIEAARDLKLHPLVTSLLLLSKKKFFEQFHLLRYDRLRAVLNDQALQDLWIRVKV